MSGNAFFLVQQKLNSRIPLRDEEILYVLKALSYVEESLNKGLTFSKLISESVEIFSESFSAESFTLIIEELYTNFKVYPLQIIHSDDIGLYDVNARLKDHYKLIYDTF